MGRPGTGRTHEFYRGWIGTFEEKTRVETASLAYNLVLHAAGLAAVPFLRNKAGQDPTFWKGRLGAYGGDVSKGPGPRIWLHAASVGEATGAVPIVHALLERLPHASCCVTVATPHGLRFARSQLPEQVEVHPFPLDFPSIVRKALQAFRPDLYVALETEFWPNLFRGLRRQAIPALLLNGRLSQRSARSYGLFKSLFQPILNQFRLLAMHSEEDRRNILQLGAPPERTLVLGSSKVDHLRLRADPEKPLRWRSVLELAPGVPVVVGGSLRRSECVSLLETFAAIRRLRPETVGLFAPRHMERIAPMVQWLEERRIPFQFFSRIERGEERRREALVLVDRIGVLFELYALGDLVFCGGTLEPIGGHNILEPAAWEKPVFYGPHLQKVLDEHNILATLGGSFMARNAEDLQHLWSYWIQHLAELERHGRSAGEALEKLGGVAARQAEWIVRTLGL